MKSFRKLASVSVFGMAFCVTAGAMYVTVGAAAIQEQAEALPLPAAVESAPPIPTTLVPPQDVLHDRQHHIELNSAGGFTGRVSTMEGGVMASTGRMSLKIVRNGQVVASTSTDEAGNFSVSGLSAGVVSVVGTHDSAILLYSVRLMDSGMHMGMKDDPIQVNEPSAAAILSMNTVAVGSTDLNAAKSLIFGNLPRSPRFSEPMTADDESYPEGEGVTSTSLDHHAVKLNEHGVLEGQVNLLDWRTGFHRQVEDLTIHFIQNGEVVGATQVQPNGQFVMPGLLPGTYSIVTTGDDGVLAMGIDVLGSTAAADEGRHILSKVAQTLDLNVSPAQTQDINTETAPEIFEEDFAEESELGPNGEIVDAPPFGGPIGAPAGGPLGTPGGGFGGGLGGGGGGIGGGGGLGALLGAAGAGLGAAALANDDDGSASPSS